MSRDAVDLRREGEIERRLSSILPRLEEYGTVHILFFFSKLSQISRFLTGVVALSPVKLQINRLFRRVLKEQFTLLNSQDEHEDLVENAQVTQNFSCHQA